VNASCKPNVHEWLLALLNGNIRRVHWY
jgi:hypothetical protein